MSDPIDLGDFEVSVPPPVRRRAQREALRRMQAPRTIRSVDGMTDEQIEARLDSEPTRELTEEDRAERDWMFSTAGAPEAEPTERPQRSEAARSEAARVLEGYDLSPIDRLAGPAARPQPPQAAASTPAAPQAAPPSPAVAPEAPPAATAQPGAARELPAMRLPRRDMPGTMLGQPMSGRVLDDPGPSKRPTVTKDAPVHRIDDGLPSEADISGARDGDVARRVFHAIAQGLRGFAGQGSTPFRSNEEQLRERREQGLDRQREMKAGDRQEAARMRAEERESQAFDAQMGAREQQGALRSRQLDIAELAERRQQRLADAQLQLQEARTQSEREEAMREIMMNRADSSISRSAQERFLIQLGSRPPAIRQMYEEVLGRTPAEMGTRLRAMSAADIAALEEEIPNVSVRVRSSLRDVGSGGPAVRLPGGGEMSLEQFRTLYTQITGNPAEAADAVYADPRARRRFIDDLGNIPAHPREGASTGGVEVMPGVRVDLDIGDVEARSLRNQFGDATSSWGTLGRIRSIADQYGSSAVITPDALARIETEMVPLRAMVARIQNTGVINPGERPLIDAVLPDPSSFMGQAMGTFRSRLDQWERQALADIQSRFSPYLSDERRDEVLGQLRRRLDSGGGRRSRPGATPRAGTPDAQPSGRRIRFTSRETGRVVVLDESDPRVATLRSRRGRYTEEPLDAARR